MGKLMTIMVLTTTTFNDLFRHTVTTTKATKGSPYIHLG